MSGIAAIQVGRLRRRLPWRGRTTGPSTPHRSPHDLAPARPRPLPLPRGTGRLVWSEAGATYAALADSDGTDDITVVSESDASTATEMVAVHEYTHESISIVKTESWDVTGAVMLVHFEVTNDGADDITDLTLVWEFDPDQDQDESEGGGLSVDPGVSTITLTDPTQDTNNDVQDPDGDGVAEWVQSVGDESGYAAGFLACDDCDDWDDAVNPSVAETWYDGVDQDCAGEDGGGADTAGDVDEDEDDDDGDKTGCSTAPGGGSFGLALLGGLGLVGLRRRQRG